MMQIREAAEYLKENLQLCGTGRVKVATGLGRGHGIPVETGISCPLVSYHSLFKWVMQLQVSGDNPITTEMDMEGFRPQLPALSGTWTQRLAMGTYRHRLKGLPFRFVVS